MRVLSLFDGISGAQQALKNLGIIPEVYYASEIDKHAIAITMKNFPNTIQLGDVRNITKEMVGEIDLYIGGFPCTDLSIAKANRLGLAGERSGLFYEALRILREIKPKYFLIENVNSMPKADKEIISKELDVECIMINSSLLSAQQRKRLYWAGKINSDGTYSKVGVTQPEDQHIYLKDVIESGDVDKLKSYCIDASYYKGTNLETYLNKAKRQLVFGKDKPDRIPELGHNYRGGRVYSIDGKSVNLTGNAGGGGAKTGLYLVDKNGNEKLKNNTIRTSGMGSGFEDKHNWDMICIKALTETRTEQAKEMRRLIKKETGKDYCSRRDKELVPHTDDKANCITTGQTKESLVVQGVAQRGRYNEDGTTSQQLELNGVDKANSLTTVQKDSMVLQDFVIRKLTPLEAERLQTFPDKFTEKGINEKGEVVISNTQRYKCLGNSFTVKVIEHILSFMIF